MENSEENSNNSPEFLNPPPPKRLLSQELNPTIRKQLEDECPAHLVRTAKVAPSMNIPEVVHFKKNVLVAGRQESVDIFLDSERVPRMISRQHAQIVQLDEVDPHGMNKWKIVDNGSINGIFVNNVKVKEWILNDNDVVVFGGGASLPLNFEKDDTKVSEFVYTFKLKKPANNKRKQVEESEEELEAKRLKNEEEEKRKKAFMEELQKREEILMQREKQMKQLEEKLMDNEKEMLKLREEQEKKEMEMLNQQKTSFHAQLEKIQSEFESEKTRLLDEQKRLQDEQQKQNLETESKQKKLELELQDKQKQLNEISTSVISRADLEEEFTCTICQELIFIAMTLECSHSFCSACIDDWLTRKKQCPICRQPITKAPVRSRAVDNAVSKIAAKLAPAERIEWDKRVGEKKKKDEEEQICKKLQELISTAKTRNLKFLNIHEAWTDAEKKVFTDGISRYHGRARSLYCETTGLNSTFISTASILKLRVAATNLGIASPDVMSNTQELKRKLTAYVEGK